MICEDCGETNKPGTEFCLFCGAYLGWQAAQPGAADTTQPIPVQSATPARAPSPVPPPQPAPAARQPVAAPAQPPPARPPGPPPGSRPTSPSRPDEPRPTQVLPATAAPAAVAAQPAAPPAPDAAATPICPTCSRPVEKGRRFCGHCGTQFIGPGDTGLAVTRPVAKRETWWTRIWDTKDRLARREYRRSLPPLYRWRRVIIGVLALGLIGGGLTLVGRSPKSFVLARYYDLTDRLDFVTPLTATTIPEGASAGGTDPKAMVDLTGAAWSMAWTAKTIGSGCGVEPTNPVVEISFAERRIRQVELRAGLLASNPNRAFQFRPKSVWIAYGDQCASHPLLDEQLQTIPLDTKVPVSSIRIGVESVTAPEQQAGVQPFLSITEIRLQARPPVR